MGINWSYLLHKYYLVPWNYLKIEKKKEKIL